MESDSSELLEMLSLFRMDLPGAQPQNFDVSSVVGTFSSFSHSASLQELRDHKGPGEEAGHNLLCTFQDFLTLTVKGEAAVRTTLDRSFRVGLTAA